MITVYPTPTQGIAIADGANLDAFARLRMSAPHTIFDSKQVFDNAPLFWDDAEESGSGTTSSHSTNTASTTIGVALNTAGKRTRQTFMRFNYQPGKSQLVYMTFVLDESGGGTGITRGVGLYDDNNGLFLLDDEGTYKLVRRTSTSGAAVDNEVAQSSWNIDTMDGTGPSGITLDFTKTQILLIDFEWLGVGRVRFGFVVDGKPYYCHEMLLANSLTLVYMSTPNLPLRYQVENDGTGAASTLEHICCSVISEGGIEENGILRYASTAGTHVDANAANTLYAVIGIRLKAAYIGCVARIAGMSMVSETNDDFEWIILLNPTVAGSFTYSDQSNSCVQTATGATANTITGGTYIDGGFVKQSAPASETIPNSRYLGAAIDGTVDEIVLCVRPLSANADIQASLTWRELL